MIVTYSDGLRKRYSRNLDDTAFHKIVDVGTKETRTVESITVSCGGTGSTVTLVITDKTGTDFPILNGKAIAANDTYIMHQQNYPLRPEESLRVKAGTADQISITIVTIDQMAVQQNQNNGRTGVQQGA